MAKEYSAPEVIEVGQAQEVILGGKPVGSPDDEDTQLIDIDLDE
jgi:hypothetical protein